MPNKLKSFLSTAWSDICDTYKRVKIYLLAALAIVAVWEWRKIKAALLVKMGQKEVDSSKKEDQDLANKEKSANDQADVLVKKSENENSDDEWYKK